MRVFDEQKRPKVGVGVVVFRGNEIVLMQRRGVHGEGSWCPPGGHLEYGESWEDCAKRETLEELGVEIENVEFLGVTNDIHEKEQKHYITIILRADIAGGENRRLWNQKKCLHCVGRRGKRYRPRCSYRFRMY
ncbi:MAG: NUDIX domain-containing protein [Patescibacteria group bacterium]